MRNWGLGRGPSFPWVSHLSQWARINHLPSVLYLCAPSLAPGSRTQMCLGSRQVRRRALVGKMVGKDVQFSLSLSCLWRICKFLPFTKLGTSSAINFPNIFSLSTSFLRTPKAWILDHLISSHIPEVLFIIFQTFSLCSSYWIISIYLFQPTDTFFFCLRY